MNDAFAKSPGRHFSVIPVKAGIRIFLEIRGRLDTRFRGYDELLRNDHE